jgi:hypothetical protein
MAETILDFNSRINCGGAEMSYINSDLGYVISKTSELDGFNKLGLTKGVGIGDLIGGDNLPHGCTRISGSSSVNTNNETISYLKSSYASGGGSVYRYRVFRG